MNRPSIGLALRPSGQSVSLPLARTPAKRNAPDFPRLRLKLYALMLGLDGSLMAAAFVAADLIRFGQPQGYGLSSFMIMFPTYVAVGLNGDAWSIASLQRPKHSAASAVRALLFAIAVASVMFFSLKIGADFSRLVFGVGSCIAVGSIAAARLAVGRAMALRYGPAFRREVLILDGLGAVPTADEIVVDAAHEGLSAAPDDPVALDRLARLLERSERAVISCEAGRRQAWTRALAGANVDVEILMPELGALPAIGLRRHGSTAALLVGCGPLPLPSRAMKRLMDIAVAGAGLVLTAPLMLAIAAAIRVESPGPALFRQERLGRANRLFSILKFRTMRNELVDASGQRSASRDDDRLTRVGRLLRRTSLDELPQLFNVLSGEMSVVGPRPHPLGCVAENQLFWTIDEHYFDRHAIKPGLTGLAQVRGFRGATQRRSDVTDRIRADLEYIDGWHIGRDIGIMFRTLGVLIHPNAF